MTQSTSSLPQDIAGWVTLAGTFVAAVIGGLGMRRGSADRDKPAPNVETAGAFGLLADGATLRDMQATLKDAAATLHGIRDDLDEEREAAKDRRHEQKLKQAEDKATGLQAKLDALQAGHEQTHQKQDEFGEQVGKLLKVMESPEFGAMMKKLEMH